MCKIDRFSVISTRKKISLVPHAHQENLNLQQEFQEEMYDPLQPALYAVLMNRIVAIKKAP